MNITNITLTDSTITIVVDESVSTGDKIYLDTVDNYSNRYSDNDENHTWVVTGKTGTTITIQLTDLEPELDTSAFTVTIKGVLGFYYDLEELYHKEVSLYTSFCNTCLDKEQKERIALFMLKYNLLDYATENNLVEDQVEHYRDLARMLGVDTSNNAQIICPTCTNCKCKNGVCALC